MLLELWTNVLHPSRVKPKLLPEIFSLASCETDSRGQRQDLLTKAQARHAIVLFCVALVLYFYTALNCSYFWYHLCCFIYPSYRIIIYYTKCFVSDFQTLTWSTCLLPSNATWFTVKSVNLSDYCLLIGICQRGIFCQWSLALETLSLFKSLQKSKLIKIHYYFFPATEEKN